MADECSCIPHVGMIPLIAYLVRKCLFLVPLQLKMWSFTLLLPFPDEAMC